MVVRPSAIRPIAGFGTLAKTTLTSLAFAGVLLAAANPAIAAPPTGWGSSTPKSVLVQSNGRRIPAPYASQSTGQEIPQGMPAEEIAPGNVATDSFDGDVQGEEVVVGSPNEGYPTGIGSYAGQQGRSYEDGVESVYGSPFNSGYESGFEGQEPGPLPCGTPGCRGDCNTCRQGSCGLPEWRYNAECEPMGLLQKIYLLHRGLKSDGGWTGRVDALILSRSAPSDRPLYTFNPGTAGTAINANQLESIAAVGPRLSLFHRDHCGNASWESTYIYSGGFVSERTLQPSPQGYQLAEPGIYGISAPSPDGLDTATARLTSSLQSAELNRRWGWGSCTQFLAGFRWLQWQETAAISDVYGAATPNFGQDVYTTGCYNNLFGGQIGLDTLLWQPAKCFRLEGLVKAGAYYNSAYQSSSYQNYVGGSPFEGNSVSVGNSPAVCSFAGELGLTGVVPICCNVDFRFGYFGLWLTSIAQPTNQLSNQLLVQGVPTYGSLTTNGNVVLQGLSLGLEGRW
jgi:hypothetical protein